MHWEPAAIVRYIVKPKYHAVLLIREVGNPGLKFNFQMEYPLMGKKTFMSNLNLFNCYKGNTTLFRNQKL